MSKTNDNKANNRHAIKLEIEVATEQDKDTLTFKNAQNKATTIETTKIKTTEEGDFYMQTSLLKKLLGK